VLVVDDEPIVREVLSRYLSRAGFEVRAAADGQAALDLFEARRPELVVLDLMLPRVDGLEVLRLPALRRTPPA
jgi:two-component system response regulator ResD